MRFNYDNETYSNSVLVPWSWEHVICTCLPPDFLFVRQDNYSCLGTINDNYRCRKCNKYALWLISMTCKTCGNRYYYHYIHHASPPLSSRNTISQSAYDGTCYDCMVEKYGSSEKDIPPVLTRRNLRNIDDILSEETDFGDDLNFTL